MNRINEYFGTGFSSYTSCRVALLLWVVLVCKGDNAPHNQVDGVLKSWALLKLVSVAYKDDSAMLFDLTHWLIRK